MRKVKESSLKVDHVTKLYGEKPSPSEILEMVNNRYKSVTYQRKGNEISKVNHEIPKVVSSPKDDISIDLGSWIQNAKVLVQVVELIKIPSQKDKLIKAIEGPKEQIVERTNERIVRVPRETNEDVPIVLHSIDWTKEDNPPFFESMVVNDLYLHKCMYDSGASSNVITKKVMDKLSLKITRPYRNVRAMDSREVEVMGIILGLQLKLVAYPPNYFSNGYSCHRRARFMGDVFIKKMGSYLGRKHSNGSFLCNHPNFLEYLCQTP